VEPILIDGTSILSLMTAGPADRRKLPGFGDKDYCVMGTLFVEVVTVCADTETTANIMNGASVTRK
jgi:hypothetical protein